jgi:exopolyphosphatase/guanosine-5'-triphosphate,3'-diphosphate pyrophosphatase
MRGAICSILIWCRAALPSEVVLDDDGLPAVEKPLSIGCSIESGAATPAKGSLVPGAAVSNSRSLSAEMSGERPLAADFRPATPPRPVVHRFAPQYAALDLGTNNCRLLVARPAGPGFRVVDAFSRIVRLGEGLLATGTLSEDAMGRALDALKICAGKITGRRVTAGRYVATEACRQAANCDVFLARVREEAGLEIEIISSAEEARLVVGGCAPLLNPRIPYAVVFDIGGGSTEIVWLRLWGGRGRRRPQLLGLVSLPFGVVTLTDRFGGTEVSPATYRAMVAETMTALAPFERTHDILRHVRTGRVQMLGSSGTVTTLAGIHLALPRYTRALVDGSVLTFEQISVVSAHLAGLDLAGRAASPCVGRERADLVLSGCAILDAICATWPVGQLRVADRGVREGILFDLMQA